MVRKKRFLFSIFLRALTAINSLVLLLVINNVNVTCAWMWGQPEISADVKEKYKKINYDKKNC